VSGDHAFQLATYTALLGTEASGETRIDSLVATKDPQLVQIDHVPGAGGERLVTTMYPLIAEGTTGCSSRTALRCYAATAGTGSGAQTNTAGRSTESTMAFKPPPCNHLPPPYVNLRVAVA
jgi:hypothetical protein